MKSKGSNIAFQASNYLVFTLFTIVCIYPFYYLFLSSVSDPKAVENGDAMFFPSGFTLAYYIHIFMLKGIAQAFFISVSRTIIGTFITVFFSALLAYVLTKNELKFRKLIYRATIFSMYASAGLIPYVITMKTLGLQNNFLLYILPGAVSPFAVILIKTYIESLSPALEESAVIDGAGYYTLFTKIIIPLSKPIVAAVAVFAAVGQWNAFQDNFFLVGKAHLQTLQLALMNYLREAESLSTAAQSGNMSFFANAMSRPMSPFTVKTTITMVTVLPILLVYPFLQKYFVKGIMLGAVKG